MGRLHFLFFLSTVYKCNLCSVEIEITIPARTTRTNSKPRKNMRAEPEAKHTVKTVYLSIRKYNMCDAAIDKCPAALKGQL